MGCSGVLALAVMACLTASAQAECTDQPLCPIGEGKKADADADKTAVADCCAACTEGTTHSAGLDKLACAFNARTCAAGHYKTASTSANEDTLCTACELGKYSAGTNAAAACDDCSGGAKCAAGSYYNVDGDACMETVMTSADTTANTNTCINCGAGEYVTAATETACKDQGKRGRVFRGVIKPPGPLPVRLLGAHIEYSECLPAFFKTLAERTS